jgi:MarR family transcriptional regulator, temperature-dependent positive regulator of motility
VVNDHRVGASAATSGRLSALSRPSTMQVAPGYFLRRMHQAYQAAWFTFVDPVVTSQQAGVLTAISAQPGAEQGAVGAAAALDPSTMTGIVSRLEKRGWVVRTRAEDDGRKRLLHLTEEGQAVHAEIVRRAQALDAVLLRGYGPKGRDVIVSFFDSLAEEWEALTEGEAPPGQVRSVLDEGAD